MSVFYPPGLEVNNKYLKRIPYSQNVKILKTKLKFKLHAQDNPIAHFSKAETIFVRIPKNASSSLFQLLFPETKYELPHYSAEFYKTLFPDYYQKWLVFAPLRNPLDRIASAFTYYRSYTKVPAEKKLMEEKYSFLKTFEDFVHWFNDVEHIEEQEMMRWSHFRKQTDYICDANNNVIVDLLFPVEDMERGLELLHKRYHFTEEVPHKNKSAPQKYDKLPVKAIERYFSEDFKIWNQAINDKIIFNHNNKPGLNLPEENSVSYA